MSFALKTLVSALLIAGAAEVAKRSAALGAVIASLPLTSVLAMIWLYRDAGVAPAADLSMSIFWAVLVSLPMFPVLAWLLRRGVGFAPALALSCGVAFAGYWGWLTLSRKS